MSALAILDELELMSWRTHLDSILRHFGDAFDDRVEHSFWNDIFLKHGARMSCGVTVISGWIGALLLYVGGKLNPVALGETKVRLDPKDFSLGLSKTPFTWEYFNVEFKMLMRGGLVGVVVDPASHAVAPQLGWLITEADDDPTQSPDYEILKELTKMMEKIMEKDNGEDDGQKTHRNDELMKKTHRNLGEMMELMREACVNEVALSCSPNLYPLVRQ